ncbi:transcriptional regulator swi6 [Dimargaris cristalligena]|nr:transcriptional regulator swi6 [Dimargaris cristalligena]
MLHEPINTVCSAVYSGIPVYEFNANSVAVMRRLADSFLNATQILKVANIPKPRRLKIIETELNPDLCEKVQGGYGKYQGTWIPFEIGVDLARRYSVYDILRPIIEYNPTNNGTTADETPSKDVLRRQLKNAETASRNQMNGSGTADLKRKPSNSGTMPASSPIIKRHRDSVEETYTRPTEPIVTNYHRAPRPIAQSSPTPSPLQTYYNPSYAPSICSSPVFGGIPLGNGSHHFIPPMALDQTGRPTPVSASMMVGSNSLLGAVTASSPMALLGGGGPASDALLDFHDSPRLDTAMVTLTDGRDETGNDGTGSLLNAVGLSPVSAVDRQRGLLMALFLSEDLPPAFDDPAATALMTPEGEPLDFDLVIDDQGHTPLHWAAALARNSLLEWLLEHDADPLKRNHAGQTPLIRAVLSTEHFDHDPQSFPNLLVHLHDTIPLVDSKSRSVIHHIVRLANDQSKVSAALYYLECLLEWIVQSASTRSESISSAHPSTAAKDSKGHQTTTLALNTDDFINFINLVDSNGDTALNIVARIGNGELIALLLRAGASVDIANNSGLKPSDFSSVNAVRSTVEDSSQGGNKRSGSEDSLLNRIQASSRPHPSDLKSTHQAGGRGQRGHKFASLVQKIVDELEDDFQGELRSRQLEIDLLQQQLKEATEELAQAKSTIEDIRGQAHDKNDIQAHINRLEAIIAHPSMGASGNVGGNGNGGGDSNGTATTAHPSSISDQPPPLLDSESTTHNIIRLKSQAEAYLMVNNLLRQQLNDVQSQATLKEFQCKKVIALCCNLPLDRVDQWVQQILAAVESETAAPSHHHHHQQQQSNHPMEAGSNAMEGVENGLMAFTTGMSAVGDPSIPALFAAGMASAVPMSTSTGHTNVLPNTFLPNNGLMGNQDVCGFNTPTSHPMGATSNNNSSSNHHHHNNNNNNNNSLTTTTTTAAMSQHTPISADSILSPSISEEQNIQRITEFMNSIQRPKKTPVSKLVAANTVPGGVGTPTPSGTPGTGADISMAMSPSTTTLSAL